MRRLLLISASSHEGSVITVSRSEATLPRTEPTSKDASEDIAELPIDCEEDWTLRAVVVGVLREADRQANWGLRQPR